MGTRGVPRGGGGRRSDGATDGSVLRARLRPGGGERVVPVRGPRRGAVVSDRRTDGPGLGRSDGLPRGPDVDGPPGADHDGVRVATRPVVDFRGDRALPDGPGAEA